MSKDKTNQKGITLIALVITIIVMLILVGVTISVALNGGLFTTAKEAAEETATKRNEELNLSDGKVEINGEWYNSIDEYVNGGQKVAITPKKETYTIGEEVTIGEESFYVIADDAEKVTLLAKDCIDTTTLVQSADADYSVAFSSTNYWVIDYGDSEEPIEIPEYPYNLNDWPIPEEVTSIITTAKTYGANLEGTGRLMTKEEATALETANSDILYGTNGKSSSTYLNYWLSVAEDSDYVWGVIGDEDYHLSQAIQKGAFFDFNEDETELGVRPVVEISKSSIS